MDNVFTVYDLMAKRGVFKSNPANRDAQDKDTKESLYKGPVMYPRMFYHPKGETRVTVPAEVIRDAFGPKLVGEQKELISKIANNAEEEDGLRKAGWWDHPAKAIHAGGGEAPLVSSDERVKELEEQMAAMQLELDAAAKEREEASGAKTATKQNVLLGTAKAS